MSSQQDIGGLVESAAEASGQLEPVHISITRATREVSNLMKATGDSVNNICLQMEKAISEECLREALRRFSPIMRIFLEAAPGLANDPLSRKASGDVAFSTPFTAALNSAATVEAYKLGVVQELAASVRRESRFVEEKDDELLSQFFPASAKPVPAIQSMLDRVAALPDVSAGASRLGRGVVLRSVALSRW